MAAVAWASELEIASGTSVESKSVGHPSKIMRFLDVRVVAEVSERRIVETAWYRVEQGIESGRVGHSLHRECSDLVRGEEAEFDSSNVGGYGLRDVHGCDCSKHRFTACAGPVSAQSLAQMQR